MTCKFSSQHILSSCLTLICISSIMTLMWYLNWNWFFVNYLQWQMGFEPVWRVHGLKHTRKVRKASMKHEILKLFNPRHIRWLATTGHMDAMQAALTIPVLLRQCMIRKMGRTKINGQMIDDESTRWNVSCFNMIWSNTCPSWTFARIPSPFLPKPSRPKCVARESERFKFPCVPPLLWLSTKL